MSSAWDGWFPEQLVRLLKPGDVIFVRGGNWIGSWLVMYLTSSWVSHVATYVGNGEVIHATTQGVVLDPLQSLVSNERDGILPFMLPLSDEERAAIVDRQMSMLGTPYSLRVVAFKAFLIISGRLWTYFRWKFAFDLLILLLAVDLCQFWFTGRILASWAMVPYLVLLACFALLSRLRPLPFSERYGVPADLIKSFSDRNFTFIGNAAGYGRRNNLL